MACLSEADQWVFTNKLGFSSADFIPCFLPWQEVRSKEGKGDYCLYHGNLSVAENEEAVFWLINNVFQKINLPFVVAGKGPSSRLVRVIEKLKNIRLIIDPPADEMEAIIRDAHIHVLPSIIRTGVKLKILNALLNGRYCLTNANGIHGTGITSGLTVLNDPDHWINVIEQLWNKEFRAAEIKQRSRLLTLYNNLQNAHQLSALW